MVFGFKKKKHKVGIALGGGGARGFAHLGVIKALNEKGIYPEIISGVSAGSIAGAFIASGRSPDEAFEIIKEYNFTGLSELKIPKTGFLSLDKLTSLLKKHIEIDQIENLPTP
ncbi:MAG: patatin-like phospholipase family protein, partial [Bacteroidota bacterium]